MQRILFAPFAVVSGLVAGFIARKAFALIWTRVSDGDPPEPDERDTSWVALAAALAVQGAIFTLARGLVDRGARMTFLRLTGRWPGEKQPEEAA